MTGDDVLQLLAYVTSIDGRNLTDLSPAAWADLLDDVALDDAMDAAREHFRESRDWLTPAHVVSGARARRRLRAEGDSARSAVEAGQREPSRPQSVAEAMTACRDAIARAKRERRETEGLPPEDPADMTPRPAPGSPLTAQELADAAALIEQARAALGAGHG